MKERLELDDFFSARWRGLSPFAEAEALQGEIVRSKPGRRTLRFELDGRGFYIKLHFGVGWGEIFKNLIYLKRTALGAGDEFAAIRHLESIGVGTMHVAAFGERGNCPAKRESFIITDELTGVTSLEDLTRNWRTSPPDVRFKRRLIAVLGATVGAMHRSGLNHRDCYLCHFLWRNDSADDPKLHVIDLHRAQIRSKVPFHYLVKDLGGLFFSSLDAGLTGRDLLRFICAYSTVPLREALKSPIWGAARRAGMRVKRSGRIG
ncbi:MAG: lipopolysaccharide core heptose(I) kinase RfaP [Victivallaceae bacterium]|nr:lipopolysaccharide core heptose(I) kinase RfaP [Victivallaceae bacterium]